MYSIDAAGVPKNTCTCPPSKSVSAAHHDVRASDIHARHLHGNLAAAADRAPKDFSELLLTPGVGARTVKALAMVAEVVHGASCRFSRPARFSLAHGGKDRHPYPVPLKVYDETIRVLKSAVQQAKLGQDEELDAVRYDHVRTSIWRRHVFSLPRFSVVATHRHADRDAGRAE
jgi:uncharacterized protein